MQSYAVKPLATALTDALPDLDVRYGVYSVVAPKVHLAVCYGLDEATAQRIASLLSQDELNRALEP